MLSRVLYSQFYTTCLILTIKLTVTCDNFVASLTKLVSAGQETHQIPFCLANSLGIAPKVSFANKLMTAVSPYIA